MMNIIITAPKHAGKSTAVGRIISMLPGSVSGFITEFVDRECDDRILKLKSIDGSVSYNAVVWKDKAYTVDFDVFDICAPELIDAKTEYIVIDELGKFEKNCDNLRNAVISAFDSSANVIASIRLDAAGWMQELKQRNDVVLICLNEENRDSVPEIIAQQLGICKNSVQ